MNDIVISSYIAKTLKKLPFSKHLTNGLNFFSSSAIQAKSFVPVKVGRETKTSKPRHGIKRSHRLLKNPRLTIQLMQKTYLHLMKRLLKNQSHIILSVDWTVIRSRFNFLSISWVMDGCGQSIPLYFTGYEKGHLCDYDECQSQPKIEESALKMVISMLSNADEIIVLMDRGFDSPQMIRYLKNLGVKFIIRSKSERWITTRRGKEILIKNMYKKPGKDKSFKDVYYTRSSKVQVMFYARWEKGQNEPWFLLSNIKSNIDEICALYARRWPIEEMFKAMKNEQTGFDIKKVRLRHLDRWLRLLFIATLVFQALGTVGRDLRKIDRIEIRYTPSSKPPKNQKYIFSIFTLAMHVFADPNISLKFGYTVGFSIKLPNSAWLRI